MKIQYEKKVRSTDLLYFIFKVCVCVYVCMLHKGQLSFGVYRASVYIVIINLT